MLTAEGEQEGRINSTVFCLRVLPRCIYWGTGPMEAGVNASNNIDGVQRMPFKKWVVRKDREKVTRDMDGGVMAKQ